MLHTLCLPREEGLERRHQPAGVKAEGITFHVPCFSFICLFVFLMPFQMLLISVMIEGGGGGEMSAALLPLGLAHQQSALWHYTVH